MITIRGRIKHIYYIYISLLPLGMPKRNYVFSTSALTYIAFYRGERSSRLEVLLHATTFRGVRDAKTKIDRRRVNDDMVVAKSLQRLKRSRRTDTCTHLLCSVYPITSTTWKQIVRLYCNFSYILRVFDGRPYPKTRSYCQPRLGRCFVITYLFSRIFIPNVGAICCLGTVYYYVKKYDAQFVWRIYRLLNTVSSGSVLGSCSTRHLFRRPK